MFFSLDYAGNGAWSKDTVISYIKEYSSPQTTGTTNLNIGSTFEGPDSASDWIDIKAQTIALLCADWSSSGLKLHYALADGVADDCSACGGGPTP